MKELIKELDKINKNLDRMNYYRKDKKQFENLNKEELIDLFENGKRNDNGKIIFVYYKSYKVPEHRLVYMIHNGKINERNIISHIDGNKKNNDINNLVEIIKENNSYDIRNFIKINPENNNKIFNISSYIKSESYYMEQTKKHS